VNATINLRRTVLLGAFATTDSLVGGLFVAFLLGSLYDADRDVSRRPCGIADRRRGDWVHPDEKG
jgi:hypothetical protein